MPSELSRGSYPDPPSVMVGWGVLADYALAAHDWTTAALAGGVAVIGTVWGIARA